MKTIIPALIISTLLFTSCKNDITPTVFVSGHLYDSCNGAPVKNQGLYLYQHQGGSNSTNTIASGGTDSMGYFKIPYGTTNPVQPIELRLSGSNYAMCRLHAYPLKDIDNLNIYWVSTCNIVVKLNVINPYTSNDTLEVPDMRTHTAPFTVKIAGPFTNGVLYTANNYTILLPDDIENGETGISPQEFGYRINNAPSYTTQDYVIKTCATNELILNIE